jgi:hypothetical protein
MLGSSRLVRSGDSGVKKGPSICEGVCFPQLGVGLCWAKDFREVSMEAEAIPTDNIRALPPLSISRRGL